MKNKIYTSLCVASFALLTFSCFGTDDGDTPAACNVDSYIDAYLSAVETFNANPTYGNCYDLKSKGIALLNAIDNCSYFEDEAYWEEAFGAYENVNCSDLL